MEWVILILIFLAVWHFLDLFTRSVKAQERIAGALEEVARKMK